MPYILVMQELEQIAEWFAVYIITNAEKRVQERLHAVGFEVYLPLQESLLQWSDRKKKIKLPLIRSVDKVYLNNTKLVYNLAKDNENTGNIRETFFLNQTRISHQVVSSTFGDVTINNMDFEVGGKNKGLKQIQTAEKGFVVKDDIERGYINVIPLWHFGLMC